MSTKYIITIFPQNLATLARHQSTITFVPLHAKVVTCLVLIGFPYHYNICISQIGNLVKHIWSHVYSCTDMK